MASIELRVFGFGTVNPAVFMGQCASKWESGEQKCNLEPLNPWPRPMMRTMVNTRCPSLPMLTAC